MKEKNNQSALISLIVMFIGFIITLFLDRGVMIILLQSGFEAGLVGGLADWFAVTALFRYPMGIPIPHTAILPNNRNRITKSLVSMVENNLLSKESILFKINNLQITRKLLNICIINISSEEFETGIIHLVNRMTNSLPREKFSQYISELIKENMHKIDSSKLIETAGDICLKYNYEQKLLDFLIDILRDEIKKTEFRNEIGNSAVKAISRIEMNPLLKYTVNTAIKAVGAEKTGEIVQDAILIILRDLNTPGNRSRHMVIESLGYHISKASSSEAINEGFNAIKENLLSSKEINDILTEQVDNAQGVVLRIVRDEAFIKEKVVPVLKNILIEISEDQEVIDKIEGYIRTQIVEYTDKNHDKIGNLVEENIEKLDNETLISMIEEKVGNDLQWIRVNGAICGFIIGIALGAIRLVLKR
ncbi:MAG: DUF445 domain-containing protein [Clostridiaceae bacterium]